MVRVGADGRIELAHPLFAAAVYAAASHERRRRLHAELAWDEDAKVAFDERVEAFPVLVRISAAKQLRDEVERNTRHAGESRVTLARVQGDATRARPTPAAAAATPAEEPA